VKIEAHVNLFFWWELYINLYLHEINSNMCVVGSPWIDIIVKFYAYKSIESILFINIYINKTELNRNKCYDTRGSNHVKHKSEKKWWLINILE
jgi:hypothetical protein